jgi:hypothetical protein
MIRNCVTCRQDYDDAERLTFCPHDRFMSAEDLEQKKAGLALIGKHVCFAHQPTGPSHFVQSVGWNGMVTLGDMVGEFAPHLFIPRVPLTIVQVFTPQDCRSGSCDCEGARNCKFPRCANCDNIMRNGKWIDDDQYHHWESAGHCPDCDGPMD